MLTKGMADKHYSQSTQEYANNQSELESLQSQRDSNQERIYELRAKENKSTDEKAELSQLQEENNLLDSQVAIKEKSVDVSKLQAANDAKTKLEKKGYQKNYKKEAYDNQDKTSINDLDEASEMIDYLNQLKSEYKDRVQKIADEGREPSWIEQKGLDSTKKKIDSLESDVADKVTEISDTAKSMKNDDGSLIDKKFKDTVASADAVVQKYLNSTDSTTATSDKMNNIFALSQFSDLKDKLIAAGKSGGTDAIQKMIDDTDGLKDAMSNAGLTADDLKDSIMSIADPDAKNLEGIKENLKDIFGKDGLGQSDFFKGKTDEELENFWDYLQDNNYNPKNMRFLLSKMHDMLDYLQPNMRRLYAGTETPEDILALSEAADRAGIGNEVYVIMPGRSVRQGDIVTGEAITRDANRLAYEWMRPGIIVANRIH